MQIAWSFGAKGVVVQAVAMHVAIMGLMTVTGVGLAIMAVSAIISAFSDKAGNATAEMKKAETTMKDYATANNTETESVKQARAALEINIAKLKDFHGTKQQEKKIVEEMNDTYGETMGYFSKVSEWYDALVKNSEAYCRQMIAEAKARNLANQIAQKEQEQFYFLKISFISERCHKVFRLRADTELTAPNAYAARHEILRPPLL